MTFRFEGVSQSLLEPIPLKHQDLVTTFQKQALSPHRYIGIDDIGLIPQKLTSKRCRKARQSHFTRDKDRYYEITSKEAKPVLLYDEVTCFFYNNFVKEDDLRFGSIYTAAGKIAQEFAGFTRQDARVLISWLRENVSTDKSTASNHRQAEIPTARSYSSSPRISPQDSSDLLQLRSRSQTPSQNAVDLITEEEFRIQFEVGDELSAFKTDLLRRQEQHGETYFDTVVSQMLNLIGTEREWPWAKHKKDEEGYDYIALSSVELQDLVRSGRTFEPIPYVVRGSETDRLMDMNELFLSQLQMFQTKTSSGIQVRDYSLREEEPSSSEASDNDDEDQENIEISFEILETRYQNCQPRGFTDGRLPLNCLDFYNIDLGVPNPVAGHSRYHGIQAAERRLRMHGTGKASYSSAVAACSSFALFALRGAYSGPHSDIYGGTWVKCLSGLKVWFVYTVLDIDECQEEIKQFQKLGHQWSPRDVFRCIILRPGDTLIMPPGPKIIHAVITAQTSVMSGGMFIDIQQLIWHIQHVSFLIDNDCTTNEFLSDDFPQVIDELVAMTSSMGLYQNQLQVLEDARSELRDKLSCNCLRGRKRLKSCGHNCPCSKRQLKKGCTVWCHSSPNKCQWEKMSKKKRRN